jgi:predicted transcriptional regulator
VLKKLCNKGVFKNDNANVSVLLTRNELIARQSRHFVEDAFGGSLPRFITSFIGSKKLTPEQVSELKRLIDEYAWMEASTVSLKVTNHRCPWFDKFERH